MQLFDATSANYPQKWRDMSLDFRLMFVSHGCMMLLFMAGQALSTTWELSIVTCLAAVLVSISMRHRHEMNWRWRGARAKNVLAALGGAILMAFFLFAGTPLFPPSDRRFLPWYLAGGGIAVFGVLAALKLVVFSKDEFVKECEGPTSLGVPKSATDERKSVLGKDPTWKRVVRGVFVTLFLLVWIDGVASFYCFGVAFRHGSPEPTATNTEPLEDHGHVVFVPRDQKVLIDRLQRIMWIGIPSILVAGFVIHYIVGVALFQRPQP